VTRLRFLVAASDRRRGPGAIADDLLSVSIHRGVVPRSSETDDLPRAEDLANYKVVRVGDVVLNRMRAFQGAVGRSDHDGIVSPDYTVLHPGPDVDSRYLHHLFRSHWFVGEMVSRLRGIGSTETGSVRTPRINWEDLGDIEVSAPVLPEQRAIADYLDAETARIDALIAKKQQLIRLLEERWRATIDTVVDGLPAARVPLRRFVRLITQGVSPQAGNSPYTTGQRGLLKLSAVRFGEFRPAENKELEPDFDFTRAMVPSRGDLLVTRANTPELVGDACAVRDPDPNVVLCDLIYLLRLDGRLMAEFAAYVLIGKRSRREFSSLARGTSQSMVKLRGEDVLSVRVPATSLCDQEEIVRRLDSERDQVGGTTGRLRQQLDLLAERRRALITAAVSGEFSVPGAHGARAVRC